MPLLELEQLFPEGIKYGARRVAGLPNPRTACSGRRSGMTITSDRPLIYLDNAATSFPKQRGLLERMIEIYGEIGVSPGRGSYDLSAEAGAFVSSAAGSAQQRSSAPPTPTGWSSPPTPPMRSTWSSRA